MHRQEGAQPSFRITLFDSSKGRVIERGYALHSRLARKVWGAGLVLAWSGLLSVVLLAVTTARAQAPQSGPAGFIHQGVATCASANSRTCASISRRSELSVSSRAAKAVASPS